MNRPAATFEQFADAVSEALPRLSPQQRLIARFVLDHPDDFALGTAATVADAAGVQPSALVRFANALHFSGFSDLQRLFRERLLERSGTYRDRINAMRPTGGSPHKAVLSHLVGLGIDDLREVEAAVPDAALQKAAALILRSRRVHLLAQRRAYPVAAYLAYALGQLDLSLELHHGIGGMLAESLRQVANDESLLVISFVNYSPETVEAAQAAHARGVPVVAITDHPLSPLKSAATVCLEIGAGAPAPVRSLIAALCVAQALVVHAGQGPSGTGKRSRRVAGKASAKDALGGSGRRR